MIETGDVVRHIPSGERWVVACVIDDRLSWCGWPEGMAALADCELIEKGAEPKGALIRQLAAMPGSDHRQRWAERELAKESEAA